VCDAGIQQKHEYVTFQLPRSQCQVIVCTEVAVMMITAHQSQLGPVMKTSSVESQSLIIPVTQKIQSVVNLRIIGAIELN